MNNITFLKPNLVDIEIISSSKSKIVIQPFEEEIEKHKTLIKKEFKKNYF